MKKKPTKELLSPLKTIRAHCLSCNDTAMEVKLCPCTNCLLYPYRFGKDPKRKKKALTEEQRSASSERLKKARAKRNESNN